VNVAASEAKTGAKQGITRTTIPIMLEFLNKIMLLVDIGAPLLCYSRVLH
jgi:hypothetical protein